MKHYNIPIFISHFGCPNACVFCNQKKINGVETDVTMDDVKEIIEKHLKTLPKNSIIEVAFFGGTFTGISLSLQKQYLSVVKKYIDNGQVHGIRISTRPECIDDEILSQLKFYGVKTIELGVQSLDDSVLEKTGRKYNFDIVKKSSELIKKYNIDLGIQLMLGLPLSNLENEIESAKKTIELKPKIARIYPTLVIKDTELETMYNKNLYKSLSLDEAVDRTKIIYAMLELAGINVIRVGLQASDDLRTDDNVVSGPFHPAFRELVENKIFFDFLKKIFDIYKKLYIISNEKNISKIIGQNGKNKKFFSNNFFIKIDNSLEKNNIIVNDVTYNREQILKGVLNV